MFHTMFNIEKMARTVDDRRRISISGNE